MRRKWVEGLKGSQDLEILEPDGGNPESGQCGTLALGTVRANWLWGAAQRGTELELARTNEAIALGNALGDGGAVALARAVPSGSLQSLRHLSLDQCGITDAGAGALAAAMLDATGGLRRLVALGLEGNDIGDEGAMAIAAALGSRGAARLQYLDLEGNRIGDGGAQALAEALAAAPELRELWVHGNAFWAAGRDALRHAWAPRDPANLWL